MPPEPYIFSDLLAYFFIFSSISFTECINFVFLFFLGYKFLRHIERCKNILHLIDITNDNLLENYSKVRKELFKYSDKLTQKREIIVFNKIDMANNKEISEKINIFNKKIKK